MTDDKAANLAANLAETCRLTLEAREVILTAVMNDGAVVLERAQAVAGVLGLVWRCGTCGRVEPAGPQANVGDSGECNFCPYGRARVEAEDSAHADQAVEALGQWLAAVEAWSFGTDGTLPPPTCPLDALYASCANQRNPFWLGEKPTFALIAELRQTRAERDAARQALAAARAAIGEAWSLRSDDAIALALNQMTTALERLCAEGGGGR